MSKVAIVTGASRGIGKAIALELGKRGFFVAINYRERAASAEAVLNEIKSLGGDGACFKVDVSDYAQVESMVNEVIRSKGGVDVLVNNAGIVSDKTLKNMAKEQWDAVIGTNLTGTFNCTKCVINSMRERNFGRIISISSVVALMGNIGQSNYAASKAGIIGFTKSVAKEVAKYNITANAIAPGFIETEMVASMPADMLAKVREQIPVGRLGKPEDVAKLVAFLASDDASYITGQVIGVNGGLYV